MAHTEERSPAPPVLGQPGFGLTRAIGPFVMAGGALLPGIPGYLAQRSHLSEPAPVPPYQRPRRVSR